MDLNKMVAFCWGITPGYVEGRDIKAGDIQQLPLREAQRYEAAHYGSVGEVLKDGWQTKPADPEILARLNREVRESIPEEQRPRPGLINIGRGGVGIYAGGG